MKFFVAALGALLGLSLPALSQADPAREVAPADGFAALGGGTTGGSAASAGQIYTVANRVQLLTALGNGGSLPKIVKVVGSIDMSEGVPFANRADQDQRAMVRLPSNTTLIGAGPGAGLLNGRIEIIGVANVIVRNLAIMAPCDVAPVWDPTDGSSGSWNAAYDAITIQGAERVWIDRNTITDAPLTDDQLPIENGKPKQCHDGAIDVTRGANHVTISYNVIDKHDKTMLIGHSDSYTADIGRLKITIANNVFSNLTQRTPRVRFGQVHLFNNYHVGSKGISPYGHSYGVGIGIGARVISNANVHAIANANPGCASVVQALSADATSSFADTGSTLNGAALGACPVHSNVGWTVPYAFAARPAALVKANNLARAGAGKLVSNVTGTGSVGVTPGSVEPARNAVGVHTDTQIAIAFDAAPTLGSTGYVTVRRNSDNAVVDRIDLSNAPSATDTQTVIPRTNLEIDALALGAMPENAARARFVWYRPVSISGNQAVVRLHSNRLAFDTAYTVTVDASAFNGSINSSPFAGLSWSFTTRSAPASKTSVAVDDDGATADFRTVQGALNWVMTHCSTSVTAHGCNTVATAKTINIRNGLYPELLMLRNVANLTLLGESRDGVQVGRVNYESLNSGSGASTATAGTTMSTGRVAGHRVLGGGRSVLLVENSDLLQLRNFTLTNPHARASIYDNQAEAIYFNTSTAANAHRMIGREMNFISEQDTLQLKGYVWIYNSLVAGNVDYIWGNVMAALFENCEIRSVLDASSSSPGYILQARATAGDVGFVFLNSQLTAGPGVTSAYLARSGGTASTTYVDNIAFINSRIGPHILPIGWCNGTGTSKTGTGQGACSSNPPPWAGGTGNGGATDAAGWREWGSKDLDGNALNTSARLGLATVTVGGSPATVQLAKTLDSTAGLTSRADIFFKSTIATGSPGGWNPAP